MLSSSSRAFSPPLSTTSSTQGSPSSAQVKKVVIEGRSKHDGVSLKVYLKLSVAVDNAIPGASIPLFPEDNIRITQSKVHPLDDRSVPYSYSSTDQPLLHKAALALQLGPKSSRSYHTLFPHSSPPTNPTPSSASRRPRENVASSSLPQPNDERYTGYIVVSGYNVTLVLPKEFPPRVQFAGPGTESDGDDGFIKDVPSSWSARSSRRASSLFQKTFLHLMAGLEVFVPYVTTPPKGPFLVSIPVPRCLDNHLKLRISTPATNSHHASVPRGSFTSTSSEDDMPGWDFLTDPPVSRKVDKVSRKNSYQQSADDEQSDSPSGPSVPGTELIQGAYQSTDVLHVRWAPPLGKRSNVLKTEDGMRRVGVENTIGKMRCEVIGRDRQGIKLGITYEGVCTGLWHPGVATMLGMDIALDVKGRRVSWSEEGAAGWAISGGNGFGGLYSDSMASTPAMGAISRKSSLESMSSSIPFLPTLATRSSTTPVRGSASLLRAPLPNQNTPDYSFENSPGATHSLATPPPGPSAYFPPATPGQETRVTRADVPPGKSVTLKVNLLKLLSPPKHEFSFSVKGTVIVDVEEEDFVPLPTFRVLGTDTEKVDTIVSKQTADGIIKIGTQPADGPRRTLRLGEEVRCEESVGLVFNSQRSPARPSGSTVATPAKHRTTSRSQSRVHSPHIKVEPSEDSSVTPTQPVGLPCVLTTVTPLPRSAQHTHCVRVNIPAYSFDADAIEFGLALPQHSTLLGSTMPTVEVLYANYAGRYVPAEVLPRGTDTLSPTLSGFNALEGNEAISEMQFWVIVHLEEVEADAGDVEVVYLVGERDGQRGDKGKGKAKEEIDFHVLLPCFQLPVSRYEVEVDCPSSFDPLIKYSTLLHQHTTHLNTLKLTHYLLPSGFFPMLALSLLASYKPVRKRSRTRRTAATILSTFPYLVALTLLYLVVSMGSEVRQVRNTINAAARVLVSDAAYLDPDWTDLTAHFHLWMQDKFMTTVRTEASTATTATSWEKETATPITPATPTINLAQATPLHEKRPPRSRQTRGNHAHAALIPLPAVPFLPWNVPLSSETKEAIAKGLMKAWYLLRKVWNYPLDPD